MRVASAAKKSAEQSLAERTIALESAEQQRQRAEKNLQLALAGFDSIMQNISQRGIASDAEFFGEVTDATSPNVTPEDAKLLQTLLGFFDELGTNNSEDLLAESAVAARRAGEIYQRLGQIGQANRAYSEALDRFVKLAEQDPDAIEHVISQSEILNELSVIAGLRGQLSRALGTFRQTLDVLNDSETALQSQAGRFQFARAHRLFASIRSRSGMDMVARRPPRRGPATNRRPPHKFLKQRIEDELRSTEIAIDTLTDLTKESPDETRFQVELARAYRDRARTAGVTRDRRESLRAIAQSIELFEKLTKQHDDSAAIRYELAVTLSSTEAFGINSFRRAAQAEALSRQLLAKSPDEPRFLALRAHTLTMLARYRSRNNQADNAAKNLDQAIEIYQSLAAKSPELSLYVTRGSQAMEAKADLLYRQGDTKSAIATLRTAIKNLQSEVKRPTASPVAKIQLQRLKQKTTRLNNEA